jgi:hypothetical protein
MVTSKVAEVMPISNEMRILRSSNSSVKTCIWESYILIFSLRESEQIPVRPSDPIKAGEVQMYVRQNARIIPRQLLGNRGKRLLSQIVPKKCERGGPLEINWKGLLPFCQGKPVAP